MTRQNLIELLDNKGISYEISEHIPVFTIEEMMECNLPYPEIIAKNLFIRDDKKKNYYLITVHEDRKINLKEFQAKFGTRKLSFASENELMSLLGVTKGAVTPFGILNDVNHVVGLYIGKEFVNGRMGIHPLENTATIWIGSKDLIDLVRSHGNEVVEF